MSRAFFGLACVLAWVAFQPSHAADLAAIADTNVDSAAPTTNFGSNGIIAVSAARTGLIRFDAAQIAQAAGGSATLKLRVLVTKNANNGVAVRLVTSAWNEKTVTAKTLPTIAAGTLDQKVITSADQGKTVIFNVAAAVAAWKNSPATNFGLAIVATSPAPNLNLGSREGGASAVLTIAGPVADNDVKVSATGGDYTSPIGAAKNALQGDHWCVSPTATKPCLIHVAGGFYPMHETLALPAGVSIVGEEKGETWLLSDAPDIAATVGSGTFIASITDLSIVSKGKGLRFSGKGLNLERMRLRAAGDVLILTGGDVRTITDSQIAMVSNGFGTAISEQQGTGALTVTRSHIIALSKNSGARGLYLERPAATAQVTLQDSTFSVFGADLSNGFLVSGTASGPTLIQHTNFNVSTTNESEGVSGFSPSDLTMLDSRIIVRGEISGIGLRWTGGTAILDGVLIDASTTAVSVSPFISDERGLFTALRSQLSAGQSAIDMRKVDVDLQSTLLDGRAAAARMTGGSSFKATTSQIKGPLSDLDPAEASTVSCHDAYNETLQLLNSHCVAP